MEESPAYVGARTRERIVAAAIETIKTHGFSGASARAIAKAGGFNQGLIYYYFADLDDLFVAALEQTSAERMSAYLPAISEVSSLEELVRVGRELFLQDAAAGHITVLAELVAAALPHPEMGARIAERMEPWTRLTQDTLDRFVRGTFLEQMVSTRALAEALVAFYLGLEMMYHLDRNGTRAETLFSMFAAVAPLASPFLNPSPPASETEP
jgi:AcrR family transcriptional regulator